MTRFAFWLTIVVLLAQLLAMEFHHHSLFDIDNDCPSCQLDAMHPAPAPAAPIASLAPMRTFVFYIALQPALFAPPDIRPYLSPYPHAPPYGWAAHA